MGEHCAAEATEWSCKGRKAALSKVCRRGQTPGPGWWGWNSMSRSLGVVQDSEDTQHMVAALRRLGVEIQTDWEAKEMVVHGCGGRFPAEGGELFLGNAGTAMRCSILAPAAAAGTLSLTVSVSPILLSLSAAEMAVAERGRGPGHCIADQEPDRLLHHRKVL